MRVLDLFCGAGGASMGYHRAGFEVVGVDVKKQPDYPFRFVQMDALEALDRIHRADFDLIHASPPCQKFSITANLARAQGKKASDIDLLTPLRPLLQASGLSYVIENVRGAPLKNPITLCGSTFNLGVRRHRLFESNLPLVDHGPCQHKQQGRPIGVYYSIGDSIPKGGKTAESLEQGQEAMGIDWMPWSSLREAIPPEYSLWIGRQAQALLS
jgi:DNA (cytosine-5)-methyltransferase 1